MFQAPAAPLVEPENAEEEAVKENGKEPEKKPEVADPQDVKENDAPEYSSDKKTDEIIGELYRLNMSFYINLLNVNRT